MWIFCGLHISSSSSSSSAAAADLLNLLVRSLLLFPKLRQAGTFSYSSLLQLKRRSVRKLHRGRNFKSKHADKSKSDPEYNLTSASGPPPWLSEIYTAQEKEDLLTDRLMTVCEDRIYICSVTTIAVFQFKFRYFDGRWIRIKCLKCVTISVYLFIEQVRLSANRSTRYIIYT